MKKNIVCLLALCFFLVSCNQHSTPNSSSSVPSSSISTPTKASPSSEEIFNEIYNKDEQEQMSRFIDSVKYEWNPFLSFCSYNVTGDSIRKVSSIGIKGLPMLMRKTFELEDVDLNDVEVPDTSFAQGMSLSEEYVLTMSCMLRMDYIFILEHSSDVYGYDPSDRLYSLWIDARESLEETLNSNATAKEKMQTYRRFGILATPFVEKEIKSGKNELKHFFVLIGAHLTTEEYLLLVERDDYAGPRVSLEEYDSALTASAEGFDYKVWLSENEEDLDNLFKYLDAFCTEYEAEQGK